MYISITQESIRELIWCRFGEYVGIRTVRFDCNSSVSNMLWNLRR